MSAGAVGEADRREPELAVRHKAEHVDRRPRLLEPVEVAAGRAPLDRHRVVVAVDRLARERRVDDREAAEAAVADHLERDALVDRARRARVDQQRVVGVAVDVDEPGRDGKPGGVDLGAVAGGTGPTAATRPSSIADVRRRPARRRCRRRPCRCGSRAQAHRPRPQRRQMPTASGLLARLRCEPYALTRGSRRSST